MVQMCAQHRANAQGKSIIHILADGANAFNCTDREELDSLSNSYITEWQHAEFMMQRHHNAVICIEAADRPLALMPNQGALMGTETAPKEFCAVYSRSVHEWDLQLRSLNPSRYRFLLPRIPLVELRLICLLYCLSTTSLKRLSFIVLSTLWTLSGRRVESRLRP